MYLPYLTYQFLPHPLQALVQEAEVLVGLDQPVEHGVRVLVHALTQRTEQIVLRRGVAERKLDGCW